METVISARRFDAPPLDHQEILRYAGAKEAVPEILALLEDCLKEAEGVPVFSACYGEFPVSMQGDKLTFPFGTVFSRDLAKNLAGCQRVFLFAATLGIGFDRLLARYSKVSPARAQMLGAIGTERVESLCEKLVSKLKEEHPELCLRPRFSPGYGDLPLSFQRDIFSVLDCSRKIGLTLNESLLMSPTKSVTAIMGIADEPADIPAKCGSCTKTDCTYRRTL